MTTKEDTRYFEERAKYKVRCKCGHTTTMKPTTNKRLCTWCGHYIYREKKDEFKDMLLKRIKV